MNERTKSIPKLYETENIPLSEKVIHQRYQIKDLDFYWLIAELDKDKNLAFGYANLNDDGLAEWGYISLDEIRENGAELDKTWKSCSHEDAIKRISKEKKEMLEHR